MNKELLEIAKQKAYNLGKKSTKAKNLPPAIEITEVVRSLGFNDEELKKLAQAFEKGKNE